MTEITDFTINNRVWHIKSSGPIAFTHIPKENSTYGILYAIWQIHAPNIIWVSQSVPALMKVLQLHLKTKFYSSFFYRCLRLQDVDANIAYRSQYKLDIKKFDRTDLQSINKFLEDKATIIFTIKDPQKWLCSSISPQHPDLNE